MISQTLDAQTAERIALVSDTHGILVDALFEQLSHADLIVHAGDIGSAQVLDTLNTIAPSVAVRGNNDTPAKWSAADGAVLQQLPEVLEINLTGGLLVVVHGHQWPKVASRHQRMRDRWPHARWIVYGHSHRRLIDCSLEPWLLNPGAAGRSRAYGGAGCLNLKLDRQRWHCTRFEIELAPR